MKLVKFGDLEGFRGLSATRHLLFHSKDWDLDLFISREDERIAVLGQVLPREPTEMATLFNAVVVLAHQGDFVQTTKMSARGEFEFQSVPDATLQVELFLKTCHLTASFRP
jgi:hypothetical protein